MITQAKIDKAIQLIKKAERLALKYNPTDGYYLAFSGGKDIQCIYHLAQLAGVKFKAHYAVTTIDPPEVMRFIKRNYPDVIWDRPELTFFQLIRKKKILPTRKIRYCCQELKETGGAGQVTITGVRRAESVKRSKRNSVEITNHLFSGTIDEFNRVFHSDDEGLQHQCIKGKDKIIINPIIDWTDNDVWSFIRNYLQIPYCSLYDMGFHRIGCMMCPMSNIKENRAMLSLHPTVKKPYLRAIEDIRKYYPDKVWKLPAEDIFEWWLSSKSANEFLLDKRQLKLDL